LQVDTTDANWISSGKTALIQHSVQNNNLTDLRTKADYVLPIGTNGKLEAGYQGTYSTSKGEDYVTNYSDNVWVEDNSRRDKVSFTDQIQAGYITFLNSMPLFDYQLGLRTEYEYRSLNQEILNKEYKVNRIDFFPSVHLTRKLPYNLQLQANYTRRINRPYPPYLNPFITQIDPQTIRQGNPELLPEFANSFELNLEKKLTDASFVSLEGYLRQTSDLMQQISIFDQATQITTNSFANIDHDRSMGAEFMVYLELLKWFSLNSSFNIFNYHMFGTPVPDVANSINTWYFHINPTFHVGKQTNLQLSYAYNAPSITAQGTRSGFYSSTLGIKQSILKSRGSLTLQVRNLLGPTDLVTITKSAHQYKYSTFQLESQVFLLTFSYRINNYGAKQSNNQDQGSSGNNKAPDIDSLGF
jgi:outer membrane receptor protein involved in Fe transport